MGWWAQHAVPRINNKTLDTGEVREWRPRVCSGLRGDIAEIGFGSGLNVPHYPSAVTGVWAVEPSDVAWGLAQPRVAASSVPVVRAGLDGAALDLPDERFDAVLSTFTFCTIPDLDAALAEVLRVLRPGGALHFLDHGLSPEEPVARWQNRLTPVNKRIADGCHLNRSIPEYVSRSGLHVETLESFYGKGPKPLAYAFLGVCRKPLRADP